MTWMQSSSTMTWMPTTARSLLGRVGLEHGQGRVRFAPSQGDTALLTTLPHRDSFAKGIHLAVRLGQWWSLFPMDLRPGMEPRFRWKSPRVAFTLIVIFAVANRLVVTSPLQEREYVKIFGDVGAHCFAISIALLYLRLAKQWRSFSLLFLRIERWREDSVAEAHAPGIGPKMRRVTLVIFGCALFEHSFDRVSLITSTMKVNNHESIKALLDDSLFQRTFSEALTTAFTHATATIMAFLYIFNDAFVILVSVYLSKRIENLNGHLDPMLTKDKDVIFWERARRSYNSLAKLTRDVDSYINTNIFVSFVQNFFFICFQLLYFLRISDEGILRNTFRIFSFTYVLIRTYMISYFAASINDHSKLARTKLFSVSSRSYCREVHRFLQQAANDEMAVTGCNFFRITRAFILTVAGTIATYEVILLQINPH